jgi:hypothetical protein
MLWARRLGDITGTVDQELLLRNEYLAAENRILRAQIQGRLLLSDAEKVCRGSLREYFLALELRTKEENLIGLTVLNRRRLGRLGAQPEFRRLNSWQSLPGPPGRRPGSGFCRNRARA